MTAVLHRPNSLFTLLGMEEEVVAYLVLVLANAAVNLAVGRGLLRK